MDIDTKNELDELELKSNETRKEINKIVEDSQKRYNILLTSISGGALFLIFQILKVKDDITQISEDQRIILFLSGSLFMISIFLNLLIPRINIFIYNKLNTTTTDLLLRISQNKSNLLYNEDEDNYISTKDISIKLANLKFISFFNWILKFLDALIILFILSGIILLGKFFYNYIFPVI